MQHCTHTLKRPTGALPRFNKFTSQSRLLFECLFDAALAHIAKGKDRKEDKMAAMVDHQPVMRRTDGVMEDAVNVQFLNDHHSMMPHVSQHSTVLLC